MAFFVFFGPRLCPRMDHPFLLPGCVVLLTICFYTALFASGTSVEEARAGGWLFDTKPPDELKFYEVWTKQDFSAVRWDLLASMDFLSTTLQVFLMAFLTTTKNVFGTAEVTHWPVDIDRELRGQGLAGILCGLAGALPGNIVMSFSVTAHKLGVRTKRFGWFLMILSLLFFVVGDFIIAFLPKMVPACVLLWLGLILIVYYLWDLIGTISMAELGIIAVMTLVDVFLDAGPMIALGLFLTLIITVKRMMAMQFIVARHSLREVRSDILRTGSQAQSLATHGHKTIVLRFAHGYFSFMNASAIIDDIEDHYADLDTLVLDFEHVLGVDTTALNALKEMAGLGIRKKFVIVMASCQKPVQDAVNRFGISTENLDLCASVSNRAVELVDDDPAAAYGCLFVCSEVSCCTVTGITAALEFAEALVIARDGTWIEDPAFPAARRTALGADVKNNSLIEARKVVVQQVGLDASLPTLPLLVDIHCWLSGYYREYECSVLRSMAEAFEFKSYARGDILYEYVGSQWPGWRVCDAAADGPVPPLVWLLTGEVDHIWTGHDFDELSHFRTLNNTYNLKTNQRIEKGVMAHNNVHNCLGMFQTTVGFFGKMMHPGRLVAATPATCVLLRRSKYDSLMLAAPSAVDALDVYLSRKRFVISALGRVGMPKLMM
eukprot:TRINITY_DN45611_c0_g1_i2.p1 TRINITY_DN45611_c0_g1~~TRINITY_DN45611_c0_g1_i2.p1  ORF type:complete len:662 (-),score=104.69 TRINITY_DN45611_c0_g1_i2:618-2603(-)